MDKYLKPLSFALVFVLVFWLAWYFRFIVFCGITALMLSFIARPFLPYLKKIKYKKFRVTNGIAAAIMLVLIIATFACLFRWVLPQLIKQIISSSDINVDNLLLFFEDPLHRIKTFLVDINVLNSSANFEDFIKENTILILKKLNYNTLVTKIFAFTWDVVLGIFTILFFTFFFIKEGNLLRKIIKLIVPNEYHVETNHIIFSSKHLISRYFIGICIEILFLTTFLFICFTLFDFPNALLISFCCGVMVIIPYLGSIIGSGIGFLILLTTLISGNETLSIYPVALKYFISFGVVKLIDDFVLQPLIYSKSVKAHPLEIFIVIMAAGKIGGVVGMILAVPLYTFIRIIAKEFFNNSKFVRGLTKNI